MRVSRPPGRFSAVTKVNALTERAMRAMTARRWSTGGAAKLAAVMGGLGLMLFSGWSAGGAFTRTTNGPGGCDQRVRGLESILRRARVRPM
jgi:hypothetical protein